MAKRSDDKRRRGRPTLRNEGATRILQVRIQPRLRERLAAAADEEGVTSSELVRRLIEERYGRD